MSTVAPRRHWRQAGKLISYSFWAVVTLHGGFRSLQEKGVLNKVEHGKWQRKECRQEGDKRFILKKRSPLYNQFKKTFWSCFWSYLWSPKINRNKFEENCQSLSTLIMGCVPAMASIKATPLVSHCLTFRVRKITGFPEGMDMLANEWIQADFIYVATYIGQVGKWRLKGYKNPRELRQTQRRQLCCSEVRVERKDVEIFVHFYFPLLV